MYERNFLTKIASHCILNTTECAHFNYSQHLIDHAVISYP